MTRNLLRNAIIFSFLFALAAGGAEAATAKRPKNFRLGWKKKPAQQVAISTEPAKPEPARVMPGRWTAETRAALDEFIAARGKLAPGYDAAKPPVAVLPWSDALVSGDPAELVFLSLTTKAEFAFEDEWWEIVPIVYGRQPARAAYEQFVKLSSSVWQSQPQYHQYRKAVLESYLGLCRGVGRRECRPYLMRLFAGWKEREAVDYSRAVIAEEKSRPAGVEIVRAEAGDENPLKLRRGLRLIPEMRDLASKLRAAGVDVWIVDDLPQPVLAAAAADYGVDPSRVQGIKAALDGARLSANVLKPIPTRGGKAEIVKALVGRPPDLVLGRDAADLDLLSYGEGLRVALTGDPALEAAARERGWLLQPSLAR